MAYPVPAKPGPGQESVWDYPRPAVARPSTREVVVRFGGAEIARTRRAWCVLETSHPPCWYLPPEDIRMGWLLPSDGPGSLCEWKGQARYLDVVVPAAADRSGAIAPRAAWFYPAPTPPFAPIAAHVAFYPAAMDGCFVDGERVRPQEGGFYGGWITDDLAGPFKGVPGSQFW